MQRPRRAPAWTTPLALGVLVWVVAAVFLVAGLGESGLWTDAELPVANRARAALGEPLSGLLASPWLPDALRTRGYAAFGGELGLRLPHAIAASLVVGTATGLARRLGASVMLSLLAGAFALALPTVSVAGRTVLGNPVAEAASALAIVAGVQALAATSRHTWAWALMSGGLLAASVASAGLVVGAVIPLAVLALAAASPHLIDGHVETGSGTETDGPRRIASIALTIAAAGCLAVGVALSLGQGDGYIPLLGAARDPELIGQPQTRRYAAIFEDFGYQVFPWAGLVLAGAVQPRGRWVALWTVTALAVAGGWSLRYGSVALPVTVPAALCAAFAVRALLHPRCSPTNRRLIALLAIAGALALRKDASLHPSRLVVPHYDVQGEHRFPAEPLQATERLRDIAKWSMAAMLVALALARRREGGRLEAVASHLPDRTRTLLSVGAVGAATAAGAWMFAHVLVPDAAALLSPKTVMERYETWKEAGHLPAELAVHRIRDAGLSLYGPRQVEAFQSRRDVMTHLQSGQPRVALVRSLDVPSLHQHARINDWPLFVLDDSHADYRLVANTLPPGAEDRNEIPAVVLNEPPGLQHTTKLGFGNYVEVIGWEVDEPLVRGQKATLRLALKVLRPLPGGTKIYTRFLKGRMFRINRDEVELANGVYPPNLWREGDYILHEQIFEVPMLEIWPGTYDFVVGLRRSAKKNIDITIPEKKRGEHGVEVRDKKRNFAKIGQVQVW